MASATARAAIREFLEANWSATPLAWENEDLAKPEPPAAWVRVDIESRVFEQRSLGAGSIAGNRWTEEGDILLHVFVPQGTGSATAATHAENLALLFRGQVLSGTLRIGDMSIGDGRGDEDGAWWILTTRIDWQRN